MVSLDGILPDEDGEAGRLDRILRDLSGRAAPDRLHGAIFHVLELADRPSFFPALHAVVGALMDARNFAVVGRDLQGRFHHEYFVDESEAVPGAVQLDAPTLTGHLLRTGRPLLLQASEIQSLVARGEVAAGEAAVAAWLGVPLHDGAEFTGALIVRSYRTAVTFSRTDLDELAVVARHVGDFLGRRRSHAQLRDSEERFRSVTETAPCAIFISQGHEIRYCNDAALGVTGFSRVELTGRHLEDLAHPDFRSLVQSYLQTGIDGRPMLPRFEFKLVRRDGEERWVDVSTGTLSYAGRPATVAVALDVTDRKRAQQQAVTLAYHDALTGLPNRRLLQDRLTIVLREARDRGRKAALMFLDLDHFKDVNDSLGHRAGDELLREIARRLRDSVPVEHTVARVGGDEFVVVLNDTEDEDVVARTAELLLDIVEQPARVCGHEVFVSASIGVAMYPEDGKDPETLIQHADAALYRAKERGRNRWERYTIALQQEASERLKLETDLRHALSRGELLLHYQPVMDLRTGHVHSVEALLRWRHPERGLLSPSAFIAHAETSRTLASLGEWILRTACAEVARWAAKGHAGIGVAVNISARQFREPGLVDVVERVLLETGLPAAQLELEITEGHAMGHAEETLRTFSELKALGVRIAIDDFGTGYSSLSYLKRFAIHTLKLDRSLLEGITTGEGDAAIATAVVQLAHTLDLSVVAEGVETQDQLEFLRRQGCDRVQGYLYSRPLPAPTCEAFLAHHGTREKPERVVRLLRRVD